VSVDRVGVVGAGLIGASIGMALARRGQQVVLVDRDERQAATAEALGAGRRGTEGDLAGCDHVVLAVPPDAVAPVLSVLQRLTLNTTFSDVASTKANVLAEAEATGCDMTRFCGGHPIAGRERGGPTAAVPELFDESVWVTTPAGATAEQARRDAAELARRCGARVIEMSATDHDQALAVVSHAAQVVASVLACQLDRAGDHGPILAGPGFRDTTRLAESEPALWEKIALANHTALSSALDQTASELAQVAAALAVADPGPLVRALERGRAARARLPVKSGRDRTRWARVGVVLQDRPGELARLFGVAGQVGVNIEDVRIDHATDHPVGLVGLDVRPEDADRLVSAVQDAGWHAVPLESPGRA